MDFPTSTAVFCQTRLGLIANSNMLEIEIDSTAKLGVLLLIA